MARNRKSRRQQHGSAWHWKQADRWYFTPPGTKKRDALFDENGERIRGKDNKESAQLALARIKLTAPKGSGIPLVRTKYGRQWKRCNGVQQFCELKKKLNLPDDRVTYTCRHTFAKRTLSGYYTGNPVSIEVLAGLMGNTPKVCWDHYAQWARRRRSEKRVSDSQRREFTAWS